MKPGIKVKMEIKQATLLLLIFFPLVLVSSSTKTLYPEKLQESKIGERTIEDAKLPKNHTRQYSVVHMSATSHASGHGGSSGGGTGGGGTDGGRGSGGGVSQGDTGGDTGSDARKPAGASNMNHHRGGGSIRVQSSVFLTWVVAILATQFSVQVL